MSQMDAAKLKKAAPGAALVLLAGPVFLFIATDLLLFSLFSARKGLAPEQIGSLASEVVFAIFAGLLAAYGARMVRRALKGGGVSYTLSVLDLSPVSLDGDQASAIRETVQVAKAAERLGYNRFWVAEHHNIGTLSSAAPEILIAALTQATDTIRLGSGGVMLVNYSPLKVAEVFMELEALAPGRIDLGVGRALGTDGRTGGALRSAGSDAFPQYFALLNAWLLDAAGREKIGDDHIVHGIHASPSGPSHPDLFMLTSSPDSADFAGRAGVGMVFAEFIARADGAPSVEAYRAAFEPSVFRDKAWAGIATIALAAETAEEAERLAAPMRASNLATQYGQRRRFTSIPEAQAYLAEHGGDPVLDGVLARAIVGDPETVRRRLDAKAAQTGADELFVMAVGPSLSTRIRSLELIKGG